MRHPDGLAHSGPGASYGSSRKQAGELHEIWQKHQGLAWIGAGIWIISLTSAAVSGRAMNLFLSASDSTRSSPRISSGHSVALGKYWSRTFAINSWRTLENVSYICNAAGSAYIQSRASR